MANVDANIALQAVHLRVEVENRVLTSDFNLELKQGECVELRGTNGSGKTTLLRHLAGIRKSAASSSVNTTQEIVYLGQTNGLNRALTPLENLKWAGQLRSKSYTQEDCLKAMSRMSLTSHQDEPVGGLSSGQQRRCALTRLLLAPETLWILDEPFNSLDQAGVELVHAILDEHLRSAGSAIVATHIPLRNLAARSIDLDSL